MADNKVWGIHTRDDNLFLKGNVIAIGWHEMGDISEIQNDREKLKQKFKKEGMSNEKIAKKYCEEIREDILKGINTSIIDKMKTHIISKNNGEEFEIEKIKKVIKKEIISQWDSKFFSDFCETEMFICLYETLLNN